MAKEQLITEKWVSKQDDCLLKEFAYVEYMIHTHDPSCSADHELICVLISNSVLGLGHDDQTTKPHISSRVKTSHTPLCLFSDSQSWSMNTFVALSTRQRMPVIGLGTWKSTSGQAGT